MSHLETRKREIRKAAAPSPTEHVEQSRLVKWWAYECKRFGVPEKLLFAIPNGGERHPAVAAKLKAEGVRTGMPDLLLSVARGGYHALYVEMKRLKGNPTESQLEVHSLLRHAGYRVEVCQGQQAARTAITTYLETP